MSGSTGCIFTACKNNFTVFLSWQPHEYIQMHNSSVDPVNSSQTACPLGKNSIDVYQ